MKRLMRSWRVRVRLLVRTSGILLLTLLTMFYSFGGLDLYLGLTTPFAPSHAEAAYSGKHLRTVEYTLGGGTEDTARTSGTLSYAGSSWNTTKGSAGTASIALEGSGIKVVSAQLHVAYITATAADVTNEHVVFDVTYSSSGGTDVPVGESLASTLYVESGLSGYLEHAYDVTSFFDRQSDTNWHAGVPVVAGVQVAGPTRALTTLKLVVTYELNYSLVAHTELKTVRFPLASTAGGDLGTRAAACAPSTTCSFTVTSAIPDAAADADILDVHVEIHGEVDSGTASTFQVGIRGGTASSSAFAWTETATDDTVVSATWNTPIGTPDFVRNSTMTFDVLMGTVPMNALGGELVVTYKYSTGASTQTETVQYFVDQRTSAPGTTRNDFATTTMTIANGGLSMKNVWLKVHAAPTAASTFTTFGKVGTSSELSSGITIAATNPRSGSDHTIILDLSSVAGNFYTASTALAGATQFSAGGSPPGVEAYLTFTWSGSSGGAQTQTATFSGAQQGANATADAWNNRSVVVTLPETVTKTYRSAYLKTTYTHSDATSITTGTVSIGMDASSTVITESADTVSESFSAHYVAPIASSTFSNGNTILWTSRTLEINESKSVADTASFGNVLVVTYEVDFAQTETSPPATHLRTIEYVLGGGTEDTARTSGTLSYAGTSWNTNKGTAGVLPIVIAGSGITVVDASLDVSYIATTASDITLEHVAFDVKGSSSGGTDVPVAEALATTLHRTSGLSGYMRHMYNVTSFFDRQSDSNWNSGIDVEAGVQVTGPTRALTTVKLVITYKANYSLVSHNEVKTVRFPLASTAASDRGTRGTQCPLLSTCSFTVTATIPDAIADADILNVYVELHGEVDSIAASTFQVGIRGGSASSSAFAWTETQLDDTVVTAAWSPPIGTPDFVRNSTMTIDVLTSLVPMNALGGELVVTYRYSTGASAQTETVRYFMDQETSAPGTTRNDFATTTMTIANGGLSMKNIWFKAHTAPVAANTFTMFGKVGTSSEVSRGITIAATNPRSGNDHTIILDLSDLAGNFYTSATDVTGATQFSAGGAPPGVEVYLTFTWSGSFGGPQTQTVTFSGAQQGANATADAWNNRPVVVTLPETVTKTYRSAYLLSKYMHSQTTNITTGTVTIGVNASSTVVTESADATSESYTSSYFAPIASSTFSNGNTILWTSRTLEINESKSVADTASLGNVIVVTYEADQELKIPTFTQNYFRFYQDNDALTPTVAWPSGAGNLGENTEITAADNPPANGDRVRIRMSLKVATTTMTASSTQFNLQFAPRVTSCAAVSSWTNLGAPGSGALWRGYNATPVDGTQLSGGDPPVGGTVLLSVSDHAGTYEESNPTAVNPFAVIVGDDVEYDWNIQNNNAATNTAYCFRMTKSDDTALWSYDFYPVITTRGYFPEQKAWRWYNDENNETPTTALAGENVAPSNVENKNTLKLRMTINETNGAGGANQKFRIQFSTYSDFSADVHYVESTSTCVAISEWCYGNGVDNDGSLLTTTLLTDSSVLGTHNEAPTTTSTFFAPASSATEFEFTVMGRHASYNTTYFFRAYDVNHARPVPLAGGSTYPSLSTEGVTLSFSISGLATSTVTEGVTTDVASEATSIPLSTILAGSGKITAQRLSVTTSASEGYQVFLGSNGSFTGPQGSIPDIASTNAAPLPWATACVAAYSGCFGYHAGDDTLAGGSTRFLVDNTYAPFASTTLEEVMYNSGPVTADTADVVYRVDIRNTQQPGDYSVLLNYVVVPTF